MDSREVLRTLPNIYDGMLYENSQRLSGNEGFASKILHKEGFEKTHCCSKTLYSFKLTKNFYEPKIIPRNCLPISKMRLILFVIYLS